MTLTLDEIYKHIKKEEEPLYQKYFEEVLDKIDVQNFTNQTLKKSFKKNKVGIEYQTIEKIANRAKKRNHLSPLILQIMLEQYFWADIIMREVYKKEWVYKVMNRENEAFFPDSMAVYHILFEGE